MTDEEFLERYQALVKATLPEYAYFHTNASSWCGKLPNAQSRSTLDLNPVSLAELEQLKVGISEAINQIRESQRQDVQDLQLRINQLEYRMSTLYDHHQVCLDRLAALENKIVPEAIPPAGERQITIGDL